MTAWAGGFRTADKSLRPGKVERDSVTSPIVSIGVICLAVRKARTPKESHAMDVASLVLPVFAIIVTGWLAGYLGYIPRSLADGLVHFAYNIAMPALLFVTIAQEPAAICWSGAFCWRSAAARCCASRWCSWAFASFGDAASPAAQCMAWLRR